MNDDDNDDEGENKTNFIIKKIQFFFLVSNKKYQEHKSELANLFLSLSFFLSIHTHKIKTGIATTISDFNN